MDDSDSDPLIPRLAGVSLGLPVYHVFDEAIKAEADQGVWLQRVGMMEMVLDTAKLAGSVAKMRAQHSKSTL
jgi:glycine/sarcosine/betaine reductase complex component A